jgi:uncharacterized protein (DUF427 family)
MASSAFIGSCGFLQTNSSLISKVSSASLKHSRLTPQSARTRLVSLSALKMVQVIYNDVIIAEADKNELPVVDGNYYFPPSSLKAECFEGPTSLHTTCGYKGVASYYNLKAGGKVAKDAAWFYPTPMEKYKHIADHVAFYKNKVTIKQ